MGGPGAGLGAPPGMPAGPGGAQPPIKLKVYDVWDTLDKLLRGKKVGGDKQKPDKPPPPPNPGMPPGTDQPPPGAPPGMPPGMSPGGVPPMG